MKQHLIPILILIAGLILAPAAAVAQDSLTTAILVRHAEKERDGSDDPALTPAGKERAEQLVFILGSLEIDAVYSTPLKRTRSTAAPLAEALGQEVRTTPLGDNHTADVARLIREDHRGDVVVVVGHSNTVPEILGHLGVDPPSIADHDYDDLFVMTLAEGAAPRLLRLRYGRATP